MQIPFSKVTMLCGRQGPKYGRSTDEQRGRGQEVGYEKWKYVKVGMIIFEKQEKKMKEHIINWFSIKRKKTERKKKWVKAAKLCKEQFCFVAFIGICLSGWGQLVIVLFVFRTSPISWRTVRTAWTKVSGRLSRVVGLLSLRYPVQEPYRNSRQFSPVVSHGLFTSSIKSNSLPIADLGSTLCTLH